MKRLALISVCVLGIAFAGSAAVKNNVADKNPVKKEATVAKKDTKKAPVKKEATNANVVKTPVKPAK